MRNVGTRGEERHGTFLQPTNNLHQGVTLTPLTRDILLCLGWQLQHHLSAQHLLLRVTDHALYRRGGGGVMFRVTDHALHRGG